MQWMNTVQHGLICASWKGYLEAVRALLNEGRVHVNVKGEYGNNAPIGASLKGYSEVIRASFYTSRRGG